MSQVKVAVARATSVALMSANLRRSLNNDLQLSSFRQHLSKYLTEFSKLVPESWSSMKELQSYTTGLNLDIMFADRSEEQTAILLTDPSTRGGCDRSDESNRRFLDHLAHLMTITKKGKYYAIPLMKPHQSTSSHTDFVCFQLLGFRPGHKKYMQRLTNWSLDVWHGALLCSTLGIFSVPKTVDNMDTALVQSDLALAFSSSNVQPWSVESMFDEDRVDHLYEFHQVHHEVAFDTSTIEDMTAEEQAETGEHDINFVNLRCSSIFIFCMLCF